MEKLELLTVKEIAKVLNVKPSTVYKYIREGIPTFSTKPYRFIADQCLNWIKER